MHPTISKLRKKLDEHPESKSLRTAISHLSQIETKSMQSDEITWDVVEHDIDTLRAEGLWEPTQEDEDGLEELRRGLASSRSKPRDRSRSQTRHTSSQSSDHAARDAAGKRHISIVMPPPVSTSLLPVSSVNTTVLPVELIEVLNHAYLLHLLATDPARVLPQGKSLLSVMLRPHVQDRQPGELPSLKTRVEDLVHRAFWDEAFESLSNPSPAVQIPRLRGLYEDLHIALLPLLPANHLLLVTLSSPLSPTSSPLRSAITHLREILVCLRERCAPARDFQIDSLIRDVDNLSSIASLAEMARLVADTVRSILNLADNMKGDLSQFVLGTMGERQLRAVLVAEAQQRERELVLQLWRPDQVQEDWERWLRDGPPGHDSGAAPNAHHRWIRRVVHTLASTIPVYCPLPTVSVTSSPDPQSSPAGNILPPSLFFVHPTLLYLQNHLQALVIAACLRSLVRVPSTRPQTSQAQPETADVDNDHFSSRIWALLKAEVDEVSGAGDTKLVNLADEVVRARKQYAGNSSDAISAEEEASLRAAVDRTLQPRDPVFLLLQKRLLEAVASRLVQPLEVPTRLNGVHLPEKLQTGRERPGQRHRLMMDIEPVDDLAKGREGVKEPPLIVKGFEDKVFVDGIGEALTKLRSCVDWIENVWPDLIDTGTLATITSAEK